MSPHPSSSQGKPAGKRPRKPPACDPCKARRVLCHPQPGGAPCPRCLEKNITCTTTPVPRGRPRKMPVESSTLPRPHQTIHSLVLHPDPSFGTSLDCPELTPEFVSHCFEGLKFNPQYSHPLICMTSIRSDVRSATYQLDLLPPPSRVLALCSIAYASLSSFHESVLGDGPRPKSFLDNTFFSSSPELLGCGVRRAAVYRALRSETLKAAWEVGIILLASNENAASCYLLDLMEQSDVGSAGRPWANAYISHVRALASIWPASSFTATDATDWAGFLMGEGLVSARSRTPMIVTSQDQLLLSGPEPLSLETLLSSLENSANDSSLSFLWASMRPYMFHATRLSRQMYDTITGDFARINPLSEVAVRNLIDSLSKLHSILELLLDRIDMVTTPPGSNPPTVLDDSSVDAVARAAAYGVCFGFSGLALPFYREMQYRETTDTTPQSERTRTRMQTLRTQVRDMAVLGLRELARGIRFLPKIHYSPVHWPTTRAWAEFAVEEADIEGRGPLSPEAARDLETFADELKLLGYSVDAASTPQTHALIERLEGHVNQALVSMFLPVTEDAWPMDNEIIADDGELILP
ncbi:hypothetical protein C8R45DRAFT_1005156 [Mycena sanguinolenta]|nr:hypothetical protein C8R45DRAFT_1005156 [Mycena sanguinolenta]